MIDIASLVKRLREFSGLTQEQVALMSQGKITQQEISLLERGKRNQVSLEKFLYLLDAMELELSIHEGFSITESTDLKDYRRLRGMSARKMGRVIDRRANTVLDQEKGDIRVSLLVPYLKAIDSVAVILTKELDINEFRHGD